MDNYRKIKKEFEKLSKDISEIFDLTLDEFVKSAEFKEAFFKFCDRKAKEE